MTHLGHVSDFLSVNANTFFTVELTPISLSSYGSSQLIIINLTSLEKSTSTQPNFLIPKLEIYWPFEVCQVAKTLGHWSAEEWGDCGAIQLSHHSSQKCWWLRLHWSTPLSFPWCELPNRKRPLQHAVLIKPRSQILRFELTWPQATTSCLDFGVQCRRPCDLTCNR